LEEASSRHHGGIGGSIVSIKNAERDDGTTEKEKKKIT